MNKVLRNAVFYALVFLIIIGIVSVFNNPNTQVESIRADQFFSHLQKNEIKSAEIQPGDEVYKITGNFKKGEKQYSTSITSEQMPRADEMLKSKEVPTKVLPADKPSQWISLLGTLIPMILIVGMLFFLMTQTQGGGGKVMNFGKSRAKLFNMEKKKVTFADVAGADEEKQELVEIVDFLKDPTKFKELGARIPKGVLLEGPPGTGKTLLARAVAGEAGVPFFSISGSDFVEMFVGVGASRVRDLFDTAKKNAPSMIFIDEIDAVGRQRGAGLGGGHDEREQTLNQMLVEMDGFGENEGVIIIAATNRSDILDPALLRPGRFDRQIRVDVPDVKGREAILRVHAKNKPLAKSVDLKAVSHRTPGFSGADLENLLNEAALVAARRDKKLLDMRDIDEATDRVIAGPAKTSRVISEKERKIVAYHEAGHTLIGLSLEDADIVHKVTIVPRGQAGGYAVMLPKEDRFLMTKTELLNKITGLLGGRVAEDVVFSEVSTGAHNDFQRATGIARRMVTEFGMSDRLGPLQFGQPQGQVFLGRDFHSERNYSDNIAYQIDEETHRIITECYDRAKQILTEKRDKLELIAQTLLEVETLDAEQITNLYEKGVLPERDYNEEEKKEVVTETVGDVKVTIAPKSEEVAERQTEKENAESPQQEEKTDDLEK